MKTLGIIGAGRYGGLVRDLAQSTAAFDNFVFFDDQQSPIAEDRKVIGKLSQVEDCYKDGAFDQLAMAIGYKHFQLRSELFSRHLEKIPFASLIHPSASISSNSQISEGVQIYSMVNVEMEAKIGRGCAVFNNSSTTHEVNLGDFSFLSVGVSMGGGVSIGSNSFIGVGASIVNDISIGSSCVVCGGTFLTDSIPDGTSVIGNPFRQIERPELA